MSKQHPHVTIKLYCETEHTPKPRYYYVLQIKTEYGVQMITSVPEFKSPQHALSRAEYYLGVQGYEKWRVENMWDKNLTFGFNPTLQ